MTSHTGPQDALPLFVEGADQLDVGAVGRLTVHTGETPGATKTLTTEQTDLFDALADTQEPPAGQPAHAYECALDGGWRQCGPWCPADGRTPPPPIVVGTPSGMRPHPFEATDLVPGYCKCGYVRDVPWHTDATPTACPTCGTARTWDTDPAADDAERFAWCPSCAVATFPSEDPTTTAAPTLTDHAAAPEWDTSTAHDLCLTCGWPVSKGSDGTWTHDTRNPVRWTDKRTEDPWTTTTSRPADPITADDDDPFHLATL